MTNPPDERGAELRELFFETSQELLQALNEESLKLEKNPGDEEIVRSIRRTVHTLKGDSAACGLRELSELAHLFEDALTLESAAAHGALAEISFAAADVFAEMLAAYHGGSPMPATESLRQRINELTAAPAAKKTRRRKKSVEPARSTGKDWTDAEKRALAQAQAAGSGSVRHRRENRSPLHHADRGAATDSKCDQRDWSSHRGAARREVASRLQAGTVRVRHHAVAGTDCRQVPHPDHCGRHHSDPDRGACSQGSRRTFLAGCGAGTRGCCRGSLRRPRFQRPPQPSLLQPKNEPRRRNPACRRLWWKTFCAWKPDASTTCSTWWANSSLASRCCSRRSASLANAIPKSFCAASLPTPWPSRRGCSTICNARS